MRPIYVSVCSTFADKLSALPVPNLQEHTSIYGWIYSGWIGVVAYLLYCIQHYAYNTTYMHAYNGGTLCVK